jgi:hypothetical protein
VLRFPWRKVSRLDGNRRFDDNKEFSPGMAFKHLSQECILTTSINQCLISVLLMSACDGQAWRSECIRKTGRHGPMHDKS